MNEHNWITAQVEKGSQEGRTINYPTVNLDPRLFEKKEQGVYASLVKIHGTTYQGALYFGPRLIKNEKNIVLEIHILDFNKEIYGENIQFKTFEFIRGILNFKNMEEMKIQIDSDIDSVKASLRSIKTD